MGILDVIRFERGSSLSISILQHGFQENILQREDRNNEYTSCHFFNFYFEPKIQSGCMLVTYTVKYIIFYQCFVCYVLVSAPDLSTNNDNTYRHYIILDKSTFSIILTMKHKFREI